jgi:BRCA2, oligonucleotide/oligosaccharide-binding, domain 1/BRCA2, helical
MSSNEIPVRPLESPFPYFETVDRMQQPSVLSQHHPAMHTGVSTPAQFNDMPAKYECKTYVTPASSEVNSTSVDSVLGIQHLFETVRKGLMISNESQCLQFGVREATIKVDSVNASLLRFNRRTSLPDTLLVNTSNDSSNLLGSLSDYRSQLKLLKCDVLKICDSWLTNHVRWIIWKLASTERKFAPYLANKYLSFNAVANQLKHRYDREFRDGSRSAVRRLLNRDISASCMFILCVARIKLCEDSQPGIDEAVHAVSRRDSTYLLELTDGWYALPAKPDNLLCNFISIGTIQVGTKLLISSASITGFEEGIDPLDRSFDSFSTHKSPVLHISINSSRLARWNSKLGLVSPKHVNAPDGMLLTKRISDIYDCGGRIPLIDLRVVRRYPVSYLDRQPCSSGTRSRILTEREEQSRVEAYEKQRQNLIDEIAEEIQAECEKVRQ